MGPTAAGKSAVAMELARRSGAEIVSVDSMQVYRGMDIGTAKPTALERSEVAHHMVDIVDPEVDYSVAEFAARGRSIIEGSPVPLVIAGGSGLHFRSLVDPMSFAPTDPEVRAAVEREDLATLAEELLEADPGAGLHVDLVNRRRVIRAVEVLRLGAGTPTSRSETAEAERLRRYQADFPFRGFGLDPGKRLDEVVGRRLASMRSGGLVEEVRGLRGRLGRNASAAVGYAEILGALEGRHSVEEAFTMIGRHTLKLARRQRTWFQRDPRIKWIPWSEVPSELADRIESEID